MIDSTSVQASIHVGAGQIVNQHFADRLAWLRIGPDAVIFPPGGFMLNVNDHDVALAFLDSLLNATAELRMGINAARVTLIKSESTHRSPTAPNTSGGSTWRSTRTSPSTSATTRSSPPPRRRTASRSWRWTSPPSVS
jgi:hypothetical protein